MGINEIVVAQTGIRSPKVLDNGLLGKYPFGVTDEVEQQLVLFSGKVNVSVFTFNSPIGNVYRQPIEDHQVTPIEGPTTHNRVYTCDKFSKMKRLNKVVLRPDFKSVNPVIYGILCRNNQNPVRPILHFQLT